MNKIIKPKAFLLLTVILAVVQIIYAYPRLPQKVAIHFSASGVADSYSSKITASVWELMIIFSLSILFYLLSKYIHKIPKSFINLPYKNYWLSSEKETESYKIISNTLLQICSFTNLLLIAVFQLVINANTTGSLKLSINPLWLMVVYLFFVTINTIKLLKFFGNPAKRKIDK